MGNRQSYANNYFSMEQLETRLNDIADGQHVPEIQLGDLLTKFEKPCSRNSHRLLNRLEHTDLKVGLMILDNVYLNKTLIDILCAITSVEKIEFRDCSINVKHIFALKKVLEHVIDNDSLKEVIVLKEAACIRNNLSKIFNHFQGKLQIQSENINFSLLRVLRSNTITALELENDTMTKMEYVRLLRSLRNCTNLNYLKIDHIYDDFATRLPTETKLRSSWKLNAYKVVQHNPINSIFDLTAKNMPQNLRVLEFGTSAIKNRILLKRQCAAMERTNSNEDINFIYLNRHRDTHQIACAPVHSFYQRVLEDLARFQQ